MAPPFRNQLFTADLLPQWRTDRKRRLPQARNHPQEIIEISDSEDVTLPVQPAARNPVMATGAYQDEEYDPTLELLDDEPAPKRVRLEDTKYPEPPRTLRESGIAFPVYTAIIVATDQEPPSEDYVNKLRRDSSKLLAQEGQVCVPEGKYSPFLHAARMPEPQLKKQFAARCRNRQGDDRALLSAGEADFYFRDADIQDQHEDDASRSRTKPSYFSAHCVPLEHVRRLRRKDVPAVSDHSTMWIRKYSTWSNNHQHYITRSVLVGMKGLCALYSFELLESLTPQQMRGLLRAIFKSSPVAHATAFFATIADTVAIDGIYRQSANAVEEARRAMYRRSIEYRFVETCMLTWKYRLNVKQKDAEDHYKKVALSKFRKMPRDDTEYIQIMAQCPGVQDIPVTGAVHNTQNARNSLFKLKPADLKYPDL